MRKNILFLSLTLALAAFASPAVPGAAARSLCPPPPNCITYPDGSQCCHTCVCTASGQIACTNNYCPPLEGGV